MVDSPCVNCWDSRSGCAYGCARLEQHHYDKILEEISYMTDEELRIQIARTETFIDKAFLPPLVKELEIRLKEMKKALMGRDFHDRVC